MTIKKIELLSMTLEACPSVLLPDVVMCFYVESNICTSHFALYANILLGRLVFFVICSE